MKIQNKKLILSFAALALFATSSFANMYEGKTHIPKDMIIKHYHMKNMPMKAHGINPEMIISKLRMIDLSQDQIKKIKDIMKEKSSDMADPLDAFSETAFDKKEFIAAIEKNKKTKLEEIANKIQKIYSVLTKEQKKDLKTIIDMEKIKKKNMMKKFS